MAFQLETEKSLNGIVNYFIRFSLCLKINQTVSEFLAGSDLFSQTRDGFGYCYSRPDYILKIFFYYFILYFNINNNNNN